MATMAIIASVNEYNQLTSRAIKGFGALYWQKSAENVDVVTELSLFINNLSQTVTLLLLRVGPNTNYNHHHNRSLDRYRNCRTGFLSADVVILQ